MKNTVGKIAIVGLGYVGLPLAVGFSKKYDVIGFDLNLNRIKELENNHDKTNEVPASVLASIDNILFTNNQEDLCNAKQFIITVPTPIDKYNNPDLSYLINASEIVSRYIQVGSHIIFESTVFPGATEEICLPILKKGTELEFNKDFFIGYSPERINPGDRDHKLENIVKVTSGSSERSATFIDDMYSSIISAGTFKASSIKVAEAAKVIENTQRDLNIALINELSLIFKKINIDTYDVLEAANTKWNFLDFKPGLVGGHCIGVDPYYLTHKSKELGYDPKIILAGRELNNAMSKNVAEEFLNLITSKGSNNAKLRILLLGLTFKENCPDTRNSKVFDLIKVMQDKLSVVEVYDPWVKDDFYDSFTLLKELDFNARYDGIMIAVGHEEFIKIGVKKIKSMLNPEGVIYDLKSVFKKNESDLRL